VKRILLISLFIIGCTTDGQDDFITVNDPNIGVPGTPQYTLTVTSGSGGSASPTSGSFNSGSVVIVTATPNSGYIFNNWSNGSTDNPISLTLDSNISLSASFVLAPTYTISLFASEGGTVSGAGTYEQGQSITLIATPNSGYKFTGWSDGSGDENRTIPVIQDLTLTANFALLSLEESLSDPSLQTSTDVDVLLDAAYFALDGRGITTDDSVDKGADWVRPGDNWWMDVISDDAHKGSTDGDQADVLAIELFSWETTNIYFQGKWLALMNGINRANAVINLINNISDPDMYILENAQARFLRGHYNFELQRMWVNVPYISEENYASDELYQPNNGPIWDKIEADFSYAANNLPSFRGGVYDEPGRPVSTTAKAYLGKTLLYQGKWNSALNKLEEVINSGLYALQSDYFANFRSDGENGPEMIFSIQFSTDSQLSERGRWGSTLNYPIGPMTGGMCCGFYQPSINLANAFQTDSNGLPLADWATTDIANDYGVYETEPHTPHTGPLDPRIDFTIARRGIDYNGYGIFTGKENIRADFTDISGPYAAKKHMYTAGDDANRGTGGWGEQRSGINYHVIRYADVLLMAAEAAIEINSLEKGRNYVNEVRSRAKNTRRADSTPNYVIDTYNSSWTDQAIARNAVRHERRVELGMEGHRLFDLRRWGTMVETLNAYIQHEGRTIANFAAKANPVSAKHNALPIPLQIILISEGVLSQNPGH
jgi:starch-binding outer membrane protein, SusD/RagB family